MLKRLWESIFFWRVQIASDDELANADVILAHEVGDQKNINKATQAVAENARALHKKFHKPVIIQYPGNLAMPDVQPIAVINSHKLSSGKYLDTNEVQRQVSEICRAHDWRKVILCSHPLHLWRAGRNLIRHGLEPIYADNRNVCCDLKCSRLVLKSEIILFPREVIARLLYLRRNLI